MLWRTPMEFFSFFFFSQLWIFMTWDFLLSPLFWDFLYSTVKTLHYTRVCSNPKKGKWGAKEEDAEGSIEKTPQSSFSSVMWNKFPFFSNFKSVRGRGEVRGTFFYLNLLPAHFIWFTNVQKWFNNALFLLFLSCINEPFPPHFILVLSILKRPRVGEPMKNIWNKVFLVVEATTMIPYVNEMGYICRRR